MINTCGFSQSIICTQSTPEAMSSFTDPVSMSVLKLQSISAFTSTTSYTGISVAVKKHPVSTSVGLSLYFKFCSTLRTSTATLREWLFLLWSVPGMGDLLLFTVEHTAVFHKPSIPYLWSAWVAQQTVSSSYHLSMFWPNVQNLNPKYIVYIYICQSKLLLHTHNYHSEELLWFCPILSKINQRTNHKIDLIPNTLLD